MIWLYRTEVLDLAPTPLGLLPRCLRIRHTCNRCGERVASEDLVAHAKAHLDSVAGQPLEDDNA